MNKFICPVCGYPYLKGEPFCGSFEICHCCGIEFGYEDCGPEEPSYYHKILRKEWVKNGMKFKIQFKKYKPENWDPIEQLKNLNLSEDEIEELKK